MDAEPNYRDEEFHQRPMAGLSLGRGKKGPTRKSRRLRRGCVRQKEEGQGDPRMKDGRWDRESVSMNET